MTIQIHNPGNRQNMEATDDTSIRARLLAVTALSARYCATLENAREMAPEEFVTQVLTLLPRLYWEFSDIEADALPGGDEYYGGYIDEAAYDSLRNSLAALLGEHDTYLETFEEDMKYSDTPIGASISEGLSDLYQPLYDFVSVVRDTNGDSLEGAFIACKEKFEDYWAQTLCNVMRPLNNLRYKADLWK